jgi:tetratricopeptide (TPR) repeat protein
MVGFYFMKSIAPVGLLPVYPREAVEAGVGGQAAAWLAIGGVLAWAWKNREGWGRHALLGLGWFLLNLLPVLGLIKMAFLHFTWVADHFAYVSLVGVVGLAIAAIPSAWTLRSAGGQAVAGAAALGCIFGLVQVRAHAANFASEERLWRATLARTPEAWLAHSNLAAALLGRKDFAGALEHAREALRLKPDYNSAHYNATMALIQLGRLEEALRFTAEAEERRMPTVDLRINLGAALLQAGRVPEALTQYEGALRAQPNSPQANRDYAVALFLAGRIAESLRHYERALPAGFDAGTHANYGLALAHAGRRAEALTQYEHAIRLAPDSPDALYNYALTLIEEGRRPEAENALRAALRFRPDFAVARDRLRELQAAKSAPP